MWPWQHAAIGYIAYSLYCRARGRTPSDRAVLAVVLGSQFPDLIDKPLGWGLGVIAGGRGFAHSVLVAVPTCLVVVGISAHKRKLAYGTAFSVGYLLHLPADSLNTHLYHGELPTNFLLWPIRSNAGPSVGGLDCTMTLTGLAECLLGPIGTLYLLGELSLLVTTLLLYRADGYPGLVRWW